MAANNADNYTNPISVNTGGSSLSTLTSHALQLGNGTSSPTQLSVGSTGTVLIGTTGSDPSFSATPPITSITFGSGTALSTYTEGTWTPTVVGGSVAGTTTYTAQAGYYTRVGNIVWLLCTCTISGATGTGDATLGGFPFTIKNQTNGSPVAVALVSGAGWTWPVGSSQIKIVGTINTTTALLKGIGTVLAAANLQMANAACNFKFMMIHQI